VDLDVESSITAPISSRVGIVIACGSVVVVCITVRIGLIMRLRISSVPIEVPRDVVIVRIRTCAVCHQAAKCHAGAVEFILCGFRYGSAVNFKIFGISTKSLISLVSAPGLVPGTL
jgi:hypothetical protein